MPTQRVPFLTVGPPLELSRRAAQIRAVFEPCSSGQRADHLRPGNSRTAGAARPLHDIKLGCVKFSRGAFGE